MLNAVKEFFKRDWTISEKVLICTCLLFLGMFEGCILSHGKKGCASADAHECKEHKK